MEEESIGLDVDVCGLGRSGQPVLHESGATAGKEDEWIRWVDMPLLNTEQPMPTVSWRSEYRR